MACMSTVSACLIVRDEEQNLALCLTALAPFVDQLCVLDTGSQDRTLEVAREHGAVVGEFTWCDDFAAARNASLALATSEWVLVVDADELLDPESAACLPDLLADEEAQAYLVWVDNLTEAARAGEKPAMNSVAIPRLFRRRPELYYSRPIHESIMESLIELGAPGPQSSALHLVHSGYLPEVVRSRGKRERNLAILEAEFSRAPRDVFNAHKLSCTYVSLEREADALRVLRESWPFAYNLAAGQRARLPFMPLMAAELARLELLSGELGRAKLVCEQGLEDAPHVSELLYQRAEVERRAGRFGAARDFYAVARTKLPWTELFAGDPDTRGVKALVGLAKTAAMSGDLGLARDALREALDLAPEDLCARTLEARLLAVAGEEQASWTALGKLLDEAPGAGPVALLAAEMAWAKGEAETALGFWQGALATAETRSAARAWLAIAKLAGGDLTPPVEPLVPADLPEAAARLVLSVIFDQDYTPDAELDRARLLEEVHAWLAELVRDPSHTALHLFRGKAGAFEAVCPGLSGLLAH